MAVLKIAVGRHESSCQELAHALHLSPVIFIGCSAGEADLVVASVFVNARPREAVRAPAVEELF
jgi:predicted naringenin-chalcone synthase